MKNFNDLKIFFKKWVSATVRPVIIIIALVSKIVAPRLRFFSLSLKNHSQLSLILPRDSSLRLSSIIPYWFPSRTFKKISTSIVKTNYNSSKKKQTNASLKIIINNNTNHKIIFLEISTSTEICSILCYLNHKRKWGKVKNVLLKCFH